MLVRLCIFQENENRSLVAGKEQIKRRLKKKKDDGENAGISAANGMDDRRNLKEISRDF